MKWIDTINKCSFGITLLLYITIIWGLLAQMALGVIQFILSMILIYNWRKYTSRFKFYLIGYWVLVVFYGLIFYFINQIESFFIVLLMVIPMSIAAYFVYLTHIITYKKDHLIASNNIKNNVL